MKEAEFAKSNLILKVRTGSHLYGTNTAESDVDYVGICIPPEDYVIGMYSFEQYQENSKSSGSDRRNTSDDSDFTIHALKKYMMLAKDNNPSILELLFTPKNNIIFCNMFGEKLLNAKKMFPSKSAYYRFSGYLHSQRSKLTTKRERLASLREALFTIDKLKQKGDEQLSEKLIVSGINENLNIWKTYEKGQNILTVEVDIKKQIEQYGSRTEYIKKYGYDTKFLMHACRLGLELIELLNTGEILFPLKERELLLNIKNGKYSLDDGLQLLDSLLVDADKLKDKSVLPEHNNIKQISDLLIDITKSFWDKGLLI